MPTTTAASDAPSNTPSRAPRKALGGWLGLAGVQIAWAFAAASGGDSESEALYDYALAVVSLLVYGVLLALTFWIAAVYPDRRQALGLTRFRLRWLGATAGVIVASIAVSLALEPLLHAGEEQGLAPEIWRPDRAGAFAVNAAVIVTLVPFAEELFFRGLGVRVLGAFGSAAAVGGTALVFALAHGLLVAIPALGFFALGLAWVRLRSASVWPGVIAHAAYNGVGLAVAYAMTQS